MLKGQGYGGEGKGVWGPRRLCSVISLSPKNHALSFTGVGGPACDSSAPLHGQVAEQPCKSPLGVGRTGQQPPRTGAGMGTEQKAEVRKREGGGEAPKTIYGEGSGVGAELLLDGVAMATWREETA